MEKVQSYIPDLGTLAVYHWERHFILHEFFLVIVLKSLTSAKWVQLKFLPDMDYT